MRNSSNSNGAAILFGILGLIILGLLIYKLRSRRRVVYMDAELIDNNTTTITGVKHNVRN